MAAGLLTILLRLRFSLQVALPRKHLTNEASKQSRDTMNKRSVASRNARRKRVRWSFTNLLH